MKKLVLVAVVLLGCQAQNDGVPAVAVAKLTLPAGARVVEKPTTASGPLGRVETEACVAGKPGAEVAEATRAGLAPAWGDVQLLPNRAVPGRWVVVGTKDGYGVSGIVDEVRRGPCADGEVYVGLGVHAVPVEEPGAKPARGAGARGVRAAESGRAPVLLPAAAE